MAWIVDYSQPLECYKSRICYKNVTEAWIGEAKCKTVDSNGNGTVYGKNERPSTVLILENK